MSGRLTIEEGHYVWDGDRTLASITAEVHQAMKNAMQTQTWPFVAEIASWDQDSVESGVIHFKDDPNFYREDAIYTLERHMPLKTIAEG